MNVVCPHCGALHWDGKKLSSSRNDDPKIGMYCFQGQVDLPAFPDPPLDLRNLLMGFSEYSACFVFKISGSSTVPLHLHLWAGTWNVVLLLAQGHTVSRSRRSCVI
jgi:hypothetical protein